METLAFKKTSAASSGSIIETPVDPDFDDMKREAFYVAQQNPSKDGAEGPALSTKLIMRTLYRAIEKQQVLPSRIHDPEEEVEPPLESKRELCDTCSPYDWRSHLTYFEGTFPDDVEFGMLKGTNIIVAGNLSGGIYEVHEDGTKISFSNVANVLANKDICGFCNLIARNLKACATKEQIEHIAAGEEPIICSFYDPLARDNRIHQDNWVMYVRVCSSENEAVGKWDVVEMRFAFHIDNVKEELRDDGQVLRKFAALNLNTHPLEAYVGRPEVKATQIDHNTLKTWWDICQKQHKDCHRETDLDFEMRKDKTNIFRVFDITSNRIILAPPDCRYVALSYVWGNISGYQSNKSDILTSSDADEAPYIPVDRNKLPKTIRDAVYVLEILGERYLWVDALCIIQDDEAEKAVLVADMDQVYMKAQLTIIAADGTDCTSGIYGLDPDSRSIQSIKGSVDGMNLVRIEPQPELDRTRWATRGWTYQEALLSRKLLVFAHKRVYYSCKRGSYGEARPLQNIPKRLLGRTLPLESESTTDEGNPIFERYTEHVHDYTSRNLTFTTDVLRAFAGITAHYGYSKQCISIWGVPINSLEIALGWFRAPHCEKLTRRSGSVKPAEAFPFPHLIEGEAAETSVSFPSWSWAGWIGPVSYDCFDYPYNEHWLDEDNPKYGPLGTMMEWPWGRDKSIEEIMLHFRDICTTGILRFSTETIMLDFEVAKEFSEVTPHDDTCELCRGETVKSTRTLVLDDGSHWTSGVKKAILLYTVGGFKDEYRSHTVLLVSEPYEKGVVRREGFLRVQRREWNAASPKKEDVSLG